MPIAWLCDFDGTVSPSDIGAAFAKRFSLDGIAARVPELAEWRAGRIGHRALTIAQCAELRATLEDALEFTRGFALDPAFGPFVREVRARGDEVFIVSEGFDFYVRDQLERAGLADVPWAANTLGFRPDRSVVPSFPFADPACDRCGNCKAGHVHRYQARGDLTVLVGDGDSDRHGAIAADVVLARGALLEWCETVGIAHVPVRDFVDVLAWARSGPEGLADDPARAIGDPA
jgi:HAD superfamily phosphoserine phosphatase-like hydrolase